MAATTLALFSLNSDVILWSRGSGVSAFPYKYSLWTIPLYVNILCMEISNLGSYMSLIFGLVVA